MVEFFFNPWNEFSIPENHIFDNKIIKNQLISYCIVSILAVCMAAILEICKLGPMGHFVTGNISILKQNIQGQLKNNSGI